MKLKDVKVGDRVECSCYKWRYRVSVKELYNNSFGKGFSGSYDTPTKIKGKVDWSNVLSVRSGSFTNPTHIKKLSV